MKNVLTLFLSLSLLWGCNDNEGTPKNQFEDYPSSYALIQAEIWDVACTSCHAAGSSFARQSDLIMTSDVSYEQLINRTPNNQSAAEDGLLLVGDLGLESLYKSFLWEKINAPDREHFYSDHPGYGSQMPLGMDALTNGELEFIRQWILAGAPKEGRVADIDVLEDESRFQSVPFVPLSVPENGYQFHIESLEVPANSEREIFRYENLNNDEPVYISGYEIQMRPGSHHFLIYDFPTDFSQLPSENEIRDVYDDQGIYKPSTLFHMEFHRFVAGTQLPFFKYTYPTGVALRVPPNAGFDINSHYANRTSDTMIGEVYANIHTIDSVEVEHTAEILNLSYDEFFLPAGKITTVEESFAFDKTRYIFQLFSHAHEHNTSFKVYFEGGERDGELIYFSNDWEHPPILQLDPPLRLDAGVGLRLEATYDNWEDRNIIFGLRSTDEMMILFGAYYE